jgi:hypothetical protein
MVGPKNRDHHRNYSFRLVEINRGPYALSRDGIAECRHVAVAPLKPGSAHRVGKG